MLYKKCGDVLRIVDLSVARVLEVDLFALSPFVSITFSIILSENV